MTPDNVPGSSKKKSIWGFLALFMLFFLSTPPAWAQKNELGILFGGTYYLGDLNPSRQFAMTRIGLGGMYRHNFGPHIAARVNGIFASVEGNDALITSPATSTPPIRPTSLPAEGCSGSIPRHSFLTPFLTGASSGSGPL